MTEERPSHPSASRIGWLDVARVLFVLAAVAFGWWGLRSRGPELRDALAQASPSRCLLAALLVLVGLTITGLVWRRLLIAMGHVVPPLPAAGIFFVGQLGKYIPGSVWSLGAQADMARRFGVLARTTVTVGLLFLWVHLVTALGVAAALGVPVAALDVLWVRLLAGVFAVVAISPPVLVRLGALLARTPEPPRMTWRGAAGLALMMVAVWGLYGMAAVLVVPPPVLTAAGGAAAVTALFVSAFALSYVVGVVVILAPAGVGAREVALVAMLAPAVGVAPAAATALLIRGVHTVCDFSIAGLAWLAARTVDPGRVDEGSHAA